MRTINVNVVRDLSYENFSTQKLIIQKFPNMKIPDLLYYIVHVLLNVFIPTGVVTLLSEHNVC